MGDISRLLFISTTEHRLAADRSKQISLYALSRIERASSLLSVGPLEQFRNVITLELRADLLAGGLRFRFFLCLFGLHGLY